MSRTRSRTIRVAGLLVAGTAAAIATALPASAHITVSPPTAEAGAYTTLTFKVPDESDTTSTTSLDVSFPVDTPIATVSVQPKPGWKYVVKKGAPSKPFTLQGSQITEVVQEIIWTADGSAGISPGEFDTFVVSAGPLPETAKSVSFKALQTYSDGEVVRWIDVPQPGQPEPDKPAPTITLTPSTGPHSDDDAAAVPAAAPAATSTSSADDTARGLGIAGLVIGALGLGAGGFALLGARRRGQSG
jgi:uncharacterized protein